MPLTFEQIAGCKLSTVFIDREENGCRFVVLRGSFSLCGYFGIPINHPLSKRDRDEEIFNELCVHFGFTFQGTFDTVPILKDWYFFGFDYSHCGDYPFYYLDANRRDFQKYFKDLRRWTVEMVEKDVEQREAFYRFQALAKSLISQAI